MTAFNIIQCLKRVYLFLSYLLIYVPSEQSIDIVIFEITVFFSKYFSFLCSFKTKDTWKLISQKLDYILYVLEVLSHDNILYVLEVLSHDNILYVLEVLSHFIKYVTK